MCCLFGDNPDEACGYPPKTIRAFISVIIVIGSFSMFAYSMIYLLHHDQYNLSNTSLAAINGILGTVIGYYFGSRNKSDVHEEVREITRSLGGNNRLERIVV